MSVMDRAYLENLIGTRIKTVRVSSSGCKKGDNVAGSLRTVKVTTESGIPYDLICKLPPENVPSMLSYIVHCRVMEMENEFYSRFLKDIQKILDSSKMASEMALPFPRYYGGSKSFLLLEDLRPQGYKMADKYKGLSFSETAIVLKHLARFHALSYFHIRQNGAKIFHENDVTELFLQFPWYPTQLPKESLDQSVNIFKGVLGVLKEDDAELGNVLESLVPKFDALFPGIYNGLDVKYFPVICLSDVWINIILFKYSEEDGSSPVDVKFIDFQQVHKGTIFEDLMYFFVTSTTPQLRKEHLLSLLRIYFESFVETLKLLKCPKPIGFTLGFLIDNFFENLINITVFVGGAVAFQLGEMPEDFNIEKETSPDDQREEEEVVEESIELKEYPLESLMSLKDHFDSIGDFVKVSLENSPRGRQRFVDIIREFHELGVFSK